MAVKLKITISKYDQFALLSVPVCFYDHKTELYYNLWVHTILTKYKHYIVLYKIHIAQN